MDPARLKALLLARICVARICVARICVSGLTCGPSAVGLVLVVEDAASLPAMAQTLEVSLSIGGVQYEQSRFDIPGTPPPHRYGLRLPDNTAGEITLNLRALDANGQGIRICGVEYTWGTTATLSKGTNEFKVVFAAADGKFSNTSTLYAAWSRLYLWAVGAGGTVLKYDGACWQREQSPVLKPEYTLKAIWGLDDNDLEAGSNNDLWVIGESSGGSPMNVLLRRKDGVWSLRAQFAGTVTAMWGLDDPTDSAKVWILGRNGTTPFIAYHQKSAGNTAVTQLSLTTSFERGTGETLADLSALYGDGQSLVLAARLNAATAPALVLYSLKDGATPMFSKVMGSTTAATTLPHTIDSMDHRVDDPLIWMAGVRTSPTATNKAGVSVWDMTTRMYTTFPNLMIDPGAVRIIASSSTIAYLARLDPAAPAEPVLRCTKENVVTNCAPLTGQAGHFRGTVTSLWRGNDGTVWITMTNGGLARISQSSTEMIDSFWAQ